MILKHTAGALALALAVVGAVVVGLHTAASADPVVTPSSGPSAGGTAISIPLPVASGALLAGAAAAGLLPPAGFSGTLAPGESVVLQGAGTAAAGTHGLFASITARVGTVQVAGSPMTISGQAPMFYTGNPAVTPPDGPSVPQGLARTGLDPSGSLALAAGLAGLGVSGLLLAAARRRSPRPWIVRAHRVPRARRPR